MSHCDEIGPLLSAYGDGELDSFQADQVTAHLDGCEKCKETVLDFLLLGHHLRGAVAMPSLDNFTERVLQGIGNQRPPLGQRIGFWLEELRESWIQVVSLAGATVALTTLVMLVAAPVTLHQLSAWVRGVPAVEVAQSGVNQPSAEVPYPALPDLEPGSSQTFISRLEATPPNVAMWSEPYTKTTVIWLGDDSPGND